MSMSIHLIEVQGSPSDPAARLFRRVGRVCAPLMISATALVALPASAQLTGAIFTTTATGTTVDANIYASKALVYLNGGPQNTNSPGLPNGTYYFQVTDPSGATLLSTDNAVCRQVVVTTLSGGKGVVSGVAPASTLAGCAHVLGSPNVASGQTPVQLLPYADTPNQGGEYKAWLIKASDATVDAVDLRVLKFTNNNVKTDNFKVKCDPLDPNCVLIPGDLFAISGYKFYDANANGVMDPTEVGIQGFQIQLFGDSASNTTTALNPLGKYSFINLFAGTYGVCEVIPTGGQTWISTTPKVITGIAIGPDSANNNFGNVCLGGGGGLTLGFWSNQNGLAILLANDANWRAGLNALNLRRATGADYDVLVLPTSFTNSYKDFRTWLLGATATNMAYMLSAQLSAMYLNVNTTGGPGATSAALVYAGPQPTACTNFVGGAITGLSGTGFISVGNLMTAANAALANPNGNTTAASNARTCQEFLKNALDRGNNNLNFVQAPGACTVQYLGTESSCSPP